MTGLFEIPETDENNSIAVDLDQNEMSDGKNSMNRYSPITPGDNRL